MFLDRDATNSIVVFLIVDDSNSPQTGFAHDEATFTLEYLDLVTGWTAVTLVSMTPGTYTENGWAEVSDGTYQFGVPNSWVVAGGFTNIRYQITGNSYRYDTLQWVGGADVQVSTTDLEAAFTSTWTQAANLPFFPITGDFQVVEGDDHKQANDRGSIGPFEVTTNVDLLDADVSLRSGFTYKSGTRYRGDEFNGTAYAEAVVGHDYSDLTIAHPYNVFIEVDGVNTAGKSEGTYGIDVEAVQDMGGGDFDIQTIMRSECTLQKSFGNY